MSDEMKKKKERVFVRGINSAEYGLKSWRKAQLEAPRVRDNTVVTDDTTVGHSHSDVMDQKHTKGWWRVGPGDDPFLTQTLQIHFVEIPPGKWNPGHAHQNEAAFYILSGKGHEIHDGERYEWEEGDLVYVHTDSHHQHFNGSDTEPALTMVFKAKSTWMYFGLWQQGRNAPLENEELYGPREDWSRIWTPGVVGLKKVVKPTDGEWEWTEDGYIRVMASPDKKDQRIFSVDVYEQKIPVGSRSGKSWHMADEVLYVMSGAGHCLQWEVAAEIDNRYYARIAKEPKRFDFKPGDTIYVPQNTVHQFFASEGEGVHIISSQNRLFRHLGYDNVVYLENAPEYDQQALGKTD